MGKTYAIAAIITMVIGSGYILYTSDIFQPPVLAPTASVGLDESDIVATSTSTTTKTKPVVSNVVKSSDPAHMFSTYDNNELGFGFLYPAMYDELQIKKFVAVGSPDLVKFSTFSFPTFSTKTPNLGIVVEGNEYVAGKEGITHPVCTKPKAEYNCIQKVNKAGTKYFEVHLADEMIGNSLRYEFPLSVDGSLVFYYYEDVAKKDEIDTLNTIMDSVTLI